jgi:hypothetical protein
VAPNRVVYVSATAFRRKTIYHRDPHCARVVQHWDPMLRTYVPAGTYVDEATARGAGLRPCRLCSVGREEATERDA